MASGYRLQATDCSLQLAARRRTIRRARTLIHDDMTRCFLGVDIGATKTHALVADEDGRALGFGQAGPGNYQVVGYPGMTEALNLATAQALAAAGVAAEQLAGAGLGVGG